MTMNSKPSTLEERLEEIRCGLPVELQHASVMMLLEYSLAEDLTSEGDLESLWPNLAKGDITSYATLSPEMDLTGEIKAKASGVACGLPLARAVFQLADERINFQANAQDGDTVSPGDLLAEVHGSGQGLLLGERPALNFLGRLSGIATLTHKFMEAIAGTHATILDTRKTTPAYRLLEKYAVRMGGGANHRMGLYDMAMVKNNHIDGAGGIQLAVERIRKAYNKPYPIEVEVRNLEELNTALALKVERIMLDNMSLETMRQAVKMTAGRVPLEASGNVTLQTVRSIAETGVDFISSGSLTHSAPVLDINLRLR